MMTVASIYERQYIQNIRRRRKRRRQWRRNIERTRGRKRTTCKIMSSSMILWKRFISAEKKMFQRWVWGWYLVWCIMVYLQTVAVQRRSSLTTIWPLWRENKSHRSSLCCTARQAKHLAVHMESIARGIDPVHLLPKFNIYIKTLLGQVKVGDCTVFEPSVFVLLRHFLCCVLHI